MDLNNGFGSSTTILTGTNNSMAPSLFEFFRGDILPYRVYLSTQSPAFIPCFCIA